MTTAELLGVMHGQLTQVNHQLSHLMSVVGGMTRRIEEVGHGARVPPGDAPPDYGTYRGVAGAYAPVRVVRPGADGKESG